MALRRLTGLENTARRGEMGIDAQVQHVGRDRPWTVRIAFAAIVSAASACAAVIIASLVTGDTTTLARVAGGCWLLSMLIPLAVVFGAATVRRGPGVWLWLATWLGAVVAVAGPFLVLLAGEPSTELVGRWGQRSEFAAQGFTWLSAVTALALVVIGLVGYRYHRRGRASRP